MLSVQVILEWGVALKASLHARYEKEAGVPRRPGQLLRGLLRRVLLNVVCSKKLHLATLQGTCSQRAWPVWNALMHSGGVLSNRECCSW